MNETPPTTPVQPPETPPVEPTPTPAPVIAGPAATPQPPKKSKKLWLWLLAALAVITVGAGVWYFFIRDDSVADQGSSQTQSASVPAPELDEQQDQIEEFVQEVSDEVAQQFDYITTKENDNSYVIVQDEATGRYVQLGKYGASTDLENNNYEPTSSTNDWDALLVQTKPVAIALEDELVSRSYRLVSGESLAATTQYQVARYENDSTICDISYAGNAATLDCVPQAELEWAVENTQPFYKAYGQTDSMVTIDIDKIEKVANKYERVTGGVTGPEEENGVPVTHGGAAALFYREAGGDWQFFEATQDIINCASYNTEILQAVYADMECYDEATPEEFPTVEEYYEQ